MLLCVCVCVKHGCERRGSPGHKCSPGMMGQRGCVCVKYGSERVYEKCNWSYEGCNQVVTRAVRSCYLGRWDDSVGLQDRADESLLLRGDDGIV